MNIFFRVTCFPRLSERWLIFFPRWSSVCFFFGTIMLAGYFFHNHPLLSSRLKSQMSTPKGGGDNDFVVHGEQPTSLSCSFFDPSFVASWRKKRIKLVFLLFINNISAPRWVLSWIIASILKFWDFPGIRSLHQVLKESPVYRLSYQLFHKVFDYYKITMYLPDDQEIHRASFSQSNCGKSDSAREDLIWFVVITELLIIFTWV